MSVVSMTGKKSRNDDYAPRNEVVPVGPKFLAGVALTLVLPTLLYCAAIGQLWPLYLLALNGALGTMLGLAMFKKLPYSFLSCVPVTFSPNVPRGASTVGLKKAA